MRTVSGPTGEYYLRVKILKHIIPVLLSILLFVGISFYVREHLDAFRLLMQGAHGYGKAAYVGLGVLSVVIPFASILPFVPAAVALWGWQTAAVLTCAAWVIGGQILFVFARTFGKPFVTKMLPESQMTMLQELVRDKGFMHSVLIRFVFHGDIISYAFGIFTHISGVRFFFVTLLASAPSATAYAYYGSLPISYQLGIGGIVILLVFLYWIGPKRVRL